MTSCPVSKTISFHTDPPLINSDPPIPKPDHRNHLTLLAQSGPSARPNPKHVASPSCQTKLLQQIQKPLKKLSLASAVPSSPASVHRRTKNASNSALVNLVLSPVSPCGPSSYNARCEQDTNERKLSAPLDYRVSGVYLGDTHRDPMLEMLTRKRSNQMKSISHVTPRDSTSGDDHSDIGSPPFSAVSPFEIISEPNPNRSIDQTYDICTCADHSKSSPTSIRNGKRHIGSIGSGRKCSNSVGESSLPSLSDLDILIDEAVDDPIDDDPDESIDHEPSRIPFRRPLSALGCMEPSSVEHLLDSGSKCPSARELKTSNGLKPGHHTDHFTLWTTKAVSIFNSAQSPFTFRRLRQSSDSKDETAIQRKKHADEEAGIQRKKISETTGTHEGNGLDRDAVGRHSLFRRSRSLTNREMGRSRKKMKEKIQHRPQVMPRQHRTGSTGDETEDTGGKDKNRELRIRKISQPAMVRFHLENEHSCFDRKTIKKKRSFAEPIAKKLSFLRRRPTDSSIVSDERASPTCTNEIICPMSPGQQRMMKMPNREDVRKWATSFEDLLSHPYGAMLFRFFLQREFSEENIDFWMACRDYKRLRDNTLLPCTAKQIYTDFVAVQAPKEVNLDSVTRSITAASCNSPTRSTFEQAQHRIQSLMEKDSYPRFLRSDLYLDLIKKC